MVDVQEKIESLESRVSKLEEKIEKFEIRTIKQSTQDSSSVTIDIPKEIIDSVMELEERIRFPILWYHSIKQIMTVEEFLTLCADTGFLLSPSWLPSAGGNFKNRLVKEDKMFKEVDKNGKNKTYTLTDIGKLKVKRAIQNIKSKK